jgi:TatD DNase family protein
VLLAWKGKNADTTTTAVPPLQFLDIGANLLASQFQGEYHGRSKHAPDLARVIARAVELGVSPIIVTCGTLSEATSTRDFIAKWEEEHKGEKGGTNTLFYTVGVHPTRSGEFDKHPEGAEAYLEGKLI